MEFEKIEGAAGMLVTRQGNYRKVDLHRIDDVVFAPHGNGFVRVGGKSTDGRHYTSNPSVCLERFTGTGLIVNKLGQLRYAV